MPSRRELIRMTDDEIKEYLADAQTLIIVSNGHNGFPHPMPMWFGVDDAGRLLCTTFAKSQKVRNWRRDPRAALLVESGSTYAELRGVVIYAQTEIVEDVAAVQDIIVTINAKGRDLSAAEREKLRETVASNAAKRLALRFTPERYVTWDHRKLGGRY